MPILTWPCTFIFCMLISVSWGETNSTWEWDAVTQLLRLSLFPHDRNATALDYRKHEDNSDTFVLLQLHIKTSCIIIILHNPQSYISACCKKDLAGSKTCFLTPTKRQIIVTLTSSDLTYKSSRETPPTLTKRLWKQQEATENTVLIWWWLTRDGRSLGGGRRSMPHLWINKFGLRPCYTTRVSFCSGDKHPAVWMWKLLELMTE